MNEVCRRYSAISFRKSSADVSHIPQLRLGLDGECSKKNAIRVVRAI